MRAKATCRLLAAPKVDSHNSFDHPDAVRPEPYGGIRVTGGAVSVKLPARSVAVVELA